MLKLLDEARPNTRGCSGDPKLFKSKETASVKKADTAIIKKLAEGDSCILLSKRSDPEALISYLKELHET